MEDLTLSAKERRMLTEPEMEEDVRIFFPHGVTQEDFPSYRALCDKLLDSSQVDASVIGRVRELLPTAAVDVRTERTLQMYNCYGAVLYTLGMEGFDFAYDAISETGDLFKIPLKGMVFFNRNQLEQSGFREVAEIEEEGAKGLVLLESSLGQRANHVATYIGNSQGDVYCFHKPLPCIPDIKPLQTLLEGCSTFRYRGREMKADVTASFWQME